MGIIKLGVISLIFFAFLITGISFFFPSHIYISRAAEIRVERDSVLVKLNNPANWKQWYPGADTAEIIIKEGKAIGFNTGELQGLVIVNSTDSSVATANTGFAAKKANSGWNIFDGSIPNSVTVQWYMDIRLHWYPWEKFSSILLEKRYGPMMEQGLDKLKKLLESKDNK